MNEKDYQNTWENYGKILLKPAKLYIDFFVNGNVRHTTGNDLAVTSLGVYLKGDEVKTSPDAQTPTEKFRNNQGSFKKAFSPLKLLNPFKIISLGCVNAQLGMCYLIDTISGSKGSYSPIAAKIIKGFVCFPFSALNTIIYPLASIEQIPPIKEKVREHARKKEAKKKANLTDLPKTDEDLKMEKREANQSTKKTSNRHATTADMITGMQHGDIKKCKSLYTKQVFETTDFPSDEMKKLQQSKGESKEESEGEQEEPTVPRNNVRDTGYKK